MTFQAPFDNSNIGTSGPGFASRGKGSHIKRLSVAPPPKISTIDETHQLNGATPRTARGHMLAGLRTAPKSAVAPASNGLESSRYADPRYNGTRAPQTTTAAYFPDGRNYQKSQYNLEQVLAPPAIDFNHGADGIDPELYDELMATNNYLAQQQRALQQQLASITAAQQFGNFNLNNAQQYQSPPVNSPMSLYQQQLQQGMQPVVQPVPGSPGMFAVYNPMTGQSSYVYDDQQEKVTSPQDNYRTMSPQHATPFQRHDSANSIARTDSRTDARSISPLKRSPPPKDDVEPLPPPSANAFRRGHNKNRSSVQVNAGGDWRGSAPKSAVPATPMSGGFAPGHGRVGEHPIRQPKGPPLLQELQEKPTSKHDGSKNFAARQRRRAVHDLVRAGRERRNDSRQPGSGAGTPGSEGEFNFSVSSDNDSVLAGSSSLTSRPSLGSLRAIGSERKEKSRERSSVDSTGALSAKSLSSDEGNAVGGPYIEVESTRRNTPLLVLSSAEKRKSVVM